MELLVQDAGVAHAPIMHGWAKRGVCCSHVDEQEALLAPLPATSGVPGVEKAVPAACIMSQKPHRFGIARVSKEGSVGSRVDEQEALVAQDAGVVHYERAGLLREVAEAHCIAQLPSGFQLCFPLLLELVEAPATRVTAWGSLKETLDIATAGGQGGL